MVLFAASLFFAAVTIDEVFAESTFQNLPDCETAYRNLTSKDGAYLAEINNTRDKLANLTRTNAERQEQLNRTTGEIADLQRRLWLHTPIGHLTSELTAWMNHFQYQYVFGIVFGAVGLLSVPFAEYFTLSGSVLVAACAVGTIVHHELPPTWHPNDMGGEAALGGIVAAMFTATAAYFGLRGFAIIMGASLGTLVALLVGCFVQVSDWSLQLQTGFYIGSALLGALATFHIRSGACAVFGPLIGGMWVASSMVFFASSIIGESESQVTWVGSLGSLLDGSGDAAGSLNDNWNTVRLVSLGVWGLVLLVGLYCSFTRPGESESDEDPEDEYRSLDYAPQSSQAFSTSVAPQKPRLNGGAGRKSNSLYDS